MSEEQNAREEAVFGQELSTDDLDAASGGEISPEGCAKSMHDLMGGDKDADVTNCANHHHRPLYRADGSINCAATVESGSFCARNDACYNQAVRYDGRKSCAKAWQ